MMRFIRELRRREVFRTAGLYVGICWILVEASTVVFPIIGIPEWVTKAAIIIAFAGFPVMLVLAWVFDVSKEGVQVQADPTETIVEQLGARKTDFVVIGILALALAISLYLNYSKDVPLAAEPAPLVVLIADIEIATDESLFGEALETALRVGIEGAPFVGTLDRTRALQIAGQVSQGATRLDREIARAVADRVEVDVLLTGSITKSGNDYRVSVEGIDLSGEGESFTVASKASSADAVFRAIGTLMLEVREQLGDASVDEGRSARALSVLSSSLEAARAYASANRLKEDGRLDEAAEQYGHAVGLDPQMGRAVAALALTEFALGRDSDAEARWSQALSLLDTMTERERLRVQGQYYATVAGDDAQALKLYAEFIEKFPADAGALEAYASASFRQLDFDAATSATRRVLDIYPGDQAAEERLALYAMYSGDFEAAETAAAEALASRPERGLFYLPVAVAALTRGDFEAARGAYRQMATTSGSEEDASIAELGLADVDLLLGRFETARERLRSAIEKDIDRGSHRAAAMKYVALAQSYAEQEDFADAVAAVESALQLSSDIAIQVPAAILYTQAGDMESVRVLAQDLAGQVGARDRAYAKMLTGMMVANGAKLTATLLEMREAISLADLWLIRYELGKTYLRAGHYPQALDELLVSKQRIGEAASIFLDNMPTYRATAELPYWIGRAEEALNMREAARKSYAEYAAPRPQTGALVKDANERVEKLSGTP